MNNSRVVGCKTNSARQTAPKRRSTFEAEENSRIPILQSSLLLSTGMAKPTDTRLRQIALIVEDLPAAERLLVCHVTREYAPSLTAVDHSTRDRSHLSRCRGCEVWFREFSRQVSVDGTVLPSLTRLPVAIGGDVIEVLAPIKEGTTAGRLLQKRGDGGYMIIMQTLDAAARREYIQSKDLSRVIYGYTEGDVECVQYHPKGIPGARPQAVA